MRAHLPVFLDQSLPKPEEKRIAVKFRALRDFAIPESAPAMGDGSFYWTGEGYTVRSERLAALAPQLAAEGKIEITTWRKEGEELLPRPEPDPAVMRRGPQLRRFLKPRKLIGWLKARLK